jgi:uncharacterized protein (TIGR00730 family)
VGVFQLSDRRRTITVFGSSLPRPGEDAYELARNLGRRLTLAGLRLCNGGYGGTMEAAARGAREACPEGTSAGTIGVTCDLFGQRPHNPWLDEIRHTSTLFERLEQLIALADGFVVLPGGTGTLLELATVLELTSQGIIEPRPLHLLGPYWESVIALAREQRVGRRGPEMLAKTSASIDECVLSLLNSLEGHSDER